MRAIAILSACLLLSGCAQYEYDLTQPRALARHIGKEQTTLPDDPLVYRLQTVENRLVMLIQNPTNDAVTLLGDRSYIVDPDGQSHPMPGQTIAPNTYIKLILPPFRPTVYNPGPSITIGAGAVYGYRGRDVGIERDFYDCPQPRYLTVYDPSDVYFFTWNGESDVRMTLSFRRGEHTFEQAFTFHRGKTR